MRALSVVLALLALPALGHAQDARSALVSSSRTRAVEGARLHFAHAIELMQDGYFEQACPWLDRALLVVDSPALRWNAAVCQNELGHMPAVVRHLRVFLLDADEDHPHWEEAFAWSRRLRPWPSATAGETPAAAPPASAPSAAAPSAAAPSAAAPSANVPSANVPSANVPSAEWSSAQIESRAPAPAPPVASRTDPVPSPRQVARAALREEPASDGDDDGLLWLGVIGATVVVIGVAVILALTLTPENDLDLPSNPHARFETR